MVFKWWFRNQMVISYSLTLRKYHQVINWNHHLRKRYHQVRYHHLRSPSSPLPLDRSLTYVFHNPQITSCIDFHLTAELVLQNQIRVKVKVNLRKRPYVTSVAFIWGFENEGTLKVSFLVKLFDQALVVLFSFIFTQTVPHLKTTLK